MASRLFRLLIGFVCLTTSGLAPAATALRAGSGTLDGEYRFHYTSPYTGLEYDYTTAGEAPDGDVTAFRMRLDAGDLVGKIRVDDPLTRIALLHPGSGLRVVVDFIASEIPGQSYIHLVLPERDEEVHFKTEDGERAGLTVRFRRGPDCATLESTGLHLAQQEAIRRLTQDHELSPQPPDHLAQITTALLFTGSLLPLVEDCGSAPVPTAGACYFDYDDYFDCVDCCDGEARIFSIACKAGKTILCKHSWCRRLVAHLCGAIEHAYLNDCVDIMCIGKEGDPSCPPTQMCGTVPGSSCWFFCGITQRSVCGKCPAGKSCCAPL